MFKFFFFFFFLVRCFLYTKDQNTYVFCLKHNYNTNTCICTIMAKKQNTASSGSPQWALCLFLLPSIISLLLLTVFPALHGSLYNSVWFCPLQRFI